MQWFFAFSADSDPVHAELARVAAATALDRAALEPHLIFDGAPDDPRLAWFARRGVAIHLHRSRLSETLERLYHPQGAIARGAFLRVDVPLLTEASFALYTDCDVMFLGDVSELDSLRPAVFAAAPEKRADDRSYFNSGMILLNVAAMRASYEAFAAYLAAAPPADLWAYDQGPLNTFYGRAHDWLEPRWNWKSYWAPDRRAEIIHFHGPKPIDPDAPWDAPADLKALHYTEHFYRWCEVWRRVAV